MTTGMRKMDFEWLIGHITHIQNALQVQAAHAVNLSLTARNWLVGYYIVEFEQHGEDRARYGESLLNTIAKRLSCRGLESRRLREYRQFYRTYPHLGSEIIRYLQNIQSSRHSDITEAIWRLPTAKSCVEDWETPPCSSASTVFYYHRKTISVIISLQIYLSRITTITSKSLLHKRTRSRE